MAATIITINALEKNVGVSSVALTLGERLNFFSNAKTCFLELDYENPSFSDILERTNTNIGIDEILPFLFSQTETEKDIKEIILHNTLQFKNCNIDVIYGTRNRHSFKEEQIEKLISLLREDYDIIIIDYGNKRLSNLLINLSDFNIVVVQPTNRYIEKLTKEFKNYIFDKKTKLLINNAASSFQEVSLTLRDKFKDTELLGELPASNTLVSNHFKGIINIEKGNYSKNINKITFNLCKKLNIEIKQKSTLISKITGKYEERENNVRIQYFTNLPLADILIEEQICTEMDIERCLKIRADREFD